MDNILSRCSPLLPSDLKEKLIADYKLNLNKNGFSDPEINKALSLSLNVKLWSVTAIFAVYVFILLKVWK